MLITCPECRFSREVPDDQIPERSKVATCPECGQRFQFRELPDAPQETPLQEDSAPGREPAPPETPTPGDTAGLDAEDANAGPSDDPAADDGETDDAPGTPPQIEVPFEDLENYGFFTGMAQTIMRASLSPRLFFEVMPLRGLARPLVFGLLVMELVVVMGALWQLTGTPNMTTLIMDTQGMAPPTVEQTLNPLHLFVLVPLLFLFNLFVSASLVHGVLSIMRSGQRGFEGTFRVLAYAYAPVVLGVIPFGLVPGGIWSLVITIIGLKHMHSTSYSRVILAYVAQLLAFALLYFVPFSFAPAP